MRAGVNWSYHIHSLKNDIVRLHEWFAKVSSTVPEI